MPVNQPRTVVIHAHGMVAAKSSNVVVQMLSKKLDFSKVHHVQFIPGGRIHVTFSNVEYRNVVLERKTIQIDDLHFLNITASDSPVTNVHVHYLPVEAGDTGLRLALMPFRTVHDVMYQQFAGFKDISTGTRIVRMSLDQHIPFQCSIQSYPCRMWYAGQPLKCTICQGAHKAADCPDRKKCKRCHQAGHFARDCKNAWGTTPPVHNFLNPQSVPPHPSGGAPPPPPSTGPPPPVHPSSDQVSPAPDGGGSVSDGPVPLMSVDVQVPHEGSDVDPSIPVDDCSPAEVVSSLASLFSSSEEQIDDFSEEISPSQSTLLPSPLSLAPLVIVVRVF